jgi:Holliday junction resolvasome RuvABC endonuclease subunit
MGLDLSLTATGLMVWDGGPVWWEEILTSPKMGCEELRWDHIQDIVMRRYRKFKPALVAIERGTSGGKNNDSRPHNVAGVVRHELWLAEAPMVLFSPNEIKQFATGNGNAGKPLMVEAAHEWLPDLKQKEHNTADALFLAKKAYDEFDDLVEAA